MEIANATFGPQSLECDFEGGRSDFSFWPIGKGNGDFYLSVTHALWNFDATIKRITTAALVERDLQWNCGTSRGFVRKLQPGDRMNVRWNLADRQWREDTVFAVLGLKTIRSDGDIEHASPWSTEALPFVPLRLERERPSQMADLSFLWAWAQQYWILSFALVIASPERGILPAVLFAKRSRWRRRRPPVPDHVPGRRWQ